MKRSSRFLFWLTGALWLSAGPGPTLAIAEQVVIAGSRQPYLIQPILDIFEAETGTHAAYRYFEANALLDALKPQDSSSPPDLLLTADVGMITEALDADLLQPISSLVLSALIPPPFRDDRQRWFGLSLRARVIVYSPERFRPEVDLSYGDLASPQFRGRLCMRSSSHVYNQSLLAALLEHWGVEKTRAWVKGITENLAHPPNGGDRDQIRAVAGGECDLTLVNTYYYAGMLGSSDPEQRALAKKVAVIWPDQNGAGVHVNISVGAVLKSAKHPELAVQFLEFLIRHAQRLFAALNYEYPIVIGIPVSDILIEMGPFQADSLPLSRLGQHRKEVKILIEEVGWR